MAALIDQLRENTSREVEVVVADSQYGTAANYLECHDRGIVAHIPSLKESRNRKGIFPDEAFSYDPENDTYLCPGGNRLKRRRYDKRDESFEYQCLARLCKACPMRDQCTASKGGRTIRRHRRYDEIQRIREKALSKASKRDLRARQHQMERTFARAVRFGFKHARWRRLWRVQIQEYLTAAIQNILTLTRNVKEPRSAVTMAMKVENSGTRQMIRDPGGLFAFVQASYCAFWGSLSNLFQSYRPLVMGE